MRCFDLHYCIFLHRALDVLQTIALSGSRKSGFSDAALECVLDCNLPAKYSLRGYLSSSNIIGQGFYDRGKVSIFNASPLFCLALPYLALPCLALPCLSFPCLALPCLALPCLAQKTTNILRFIE